MQLSSSFAAAALVNTIGHHHLLRELQAPCEVFINHRGVDTKRNVAGLLYHYLRSLGLVPFLDSKNMKPGDRLFDKIKNLIEVEEEELVLQHKKRQ